LNSIEICADTGGQLLTVQEHIRKLAKVRIHQEKSQHLDVIGMLVKLREDIPGKQPVNRWVAADYWKPRQDLRACGVQVSSDLGYILCGLSFQGVDAI